MGNKINMKRDLTKERAKGELDALWEMVTKPFGEIKLMVKDESINRESWLIASVLTLPKVQRVKMIQWLFEMVLGKPKQQVDSEQLEREIRIVIDKIEADL